MTPTPRGPIEWVLFDVDGTLLDYRATESAALRATLASIGVEATADLVSTYATINASHWAALERNETTPERIRVERWRDFADAVGVATDPETVAEFYVASLASAHHPLPHAADVVARLAADRGIGVITNGFGDVQRPRLAAAGLLDHVRSMTVSDEVGASKPDPVIFAHALASMGDPDPAHVLIVGDNVVADIAGGAAAGMRTCFYDGHAPMRADVLADPGLVGADHAVRDLRGVLDIVGAR